MDPENWELTPEDVIKMPLGEFAARFGFTPIDALEKVWFAATAKRLDGLSRDAIRLGIIGIPNLDHVVME